MEKVASRTEQAIRDYLSSDINLALQLDGAWGSGKTFYVKSLIEELNNEGNKVAIYFSLYGFDNLGEIKSELVEKIVSETIIGGKLTAFYDKNRKKIAKINQIFENSKLKPLGAVLDLISEAYKNKVKGLPDKEIIIFIDDLERLSKSVELTDLFGFINSELLDKLGFKIVIISNSKKIVEDNSKKNVEDNSKEIWEKTVERTINFSCEWDIVENIILSRIKNLRISSDKEWVYEIVKNYLYHDGKINLRILQSILSNYNFLEGKILTIEVGNYEGQQIEICKSIFLNTLVITEFTKLKNLDSHNLSKINYLCNTRTFFRKDLLGFGNSTSQGGKDSEDLGSRIVKEYHKNVESFNKYIFYSSQINNYIVKGYFEGKFYDYLDIWYKLFDETSYTISGLISQMQRFDDMTDTQLQDIQDKIISEVTSARIPTMKELLQTFFQLAQFSKMDLILTNIYNDWREAFSSEVLRDVARKQGVLDNLPEFKEENPRYLYEDSILDEDYAWILEKYEEIRIPEQSKKESEALKSIFCKSLTNDKRDILHRIGTEEVVRRIASEKYIDDYVLKVPSAARELWLYLRRENHFNNSPEDLQKIIGKIENGKNKINDKIALFGIIELLDYLNENKRQEQLAKENI
jgi:hypothetical protein